jgi:dTDP-4-dehydrorhamnose 3,5-epimerase-like enzyme
VRVDWRRDPDFGNLGIIEFSRLDFVPQRIYWVENFVPGAIRGNHAHKKLNQALFCLKGKVDLELVQGRNIRSVTLHNQEEVFYVEPGTWRRFSSEDPSSILLVICDQPFSEEDYIRNWDEYLEWYESHHGS